MPKTHMPLPSQAYLRERFDYDAATGELRWRPTAVRYARLKGQLAGSVNANGYLVVKSGTTRFLVHRLIWMWVYGEDPGPLEIDHKDRDRLNNRIDNLRLATTQLQSWNTGSRKGASSAFKGVSWCARTQVWKAQIVIGGRKPNLGAFTSEEEAAAAYDQAAAALHGEFGIGRQTDAAAAELPVHQRPRRDNTSGFRGVSRKGSRWQAAIRPRGHEKQIHLGTFDTPEEASRAYQQAQEALK